MDEEDGFDESRSHLEFGFLELDLGYFKDEVEDRMDKGEEPERVELGNEETGKPVVYQEKIMFEHVKDEGKEDGDWNERSKDPTHELGNQNTDYLRGS